MGVRGHSGGHGSAGPVGRGCRGGHGGGVGQSGVCTGGGGRGGGATGIEGARAHRAASFSGLGCERRGSAGARHSRGDRMTTARSRFIAAAFDHGQVPTIACFNKAATALGVDFDRLVAALQKFVDEYFVPVWGTPARLVRTTGFRKGAWALAFLDTADVANALGYHDLTPDGLPLSKVFVKTTLAARQHVNVTACHEPAGMLVD